MSNEAVINLVFNSEDAKRQIETFKEGFKNTMGGLVSLAGGIKVFKDIFGDINSEIQRGIGLANLSNYLNMPVKDVQAFQYELMQLGVSGEKAGELLKSVDGAIVDLIHNEGKLKYLATNLGIGVDISEDSLTIFKKIVEATRELQPLAQKDVLKKLGLDAEEFYRYINLSDEELERMQQQSRRGLLSRETEEQLKKLRDNWNEFRTHIEQAKASILNDLTPAISKVNEFLTILNSKTDDWYKKFIMIGEFLKVALGGALIGSVINIFKGMGGIFSTIGVGIGKILLSGLAFVLGGLGFILENLLYLAVVYAVGYVFGWMGAKVVQFVDWAKGLFRNDENTGKNFNRDVALENLKNKDPEAYARFMANQGEKAPRTRGVNNDVLEDTYDVPLGMKDIYESAGWYKMSNNTNNKNNNVTINIYAQSDKAQDIQNAVLQAVNTIKV